MAASLRALAELYSENAPCPCNRKPDTHSKTTWPRSAKRYLLVSQSKVAVELYIRQSDERWLMSEYSGLGAEVSLESVDCRLSLREIYDKVDLSATAPPA
jgi:hypothetical protein